MGPPMGPRPFNIRFITGQLAELTFTERKGPFWNRRTEERHVQARKESGHWYWRKSGRPVHGWALCELENAARVDRWDNDRV